MGRRDPLPDSLDVNRDALSYFKVGTIYPSLPDRRDFMKIAKAEQVATLPDEWEMPEDEEENQGPTGACGAFTVIEALEEEYKRQGRDPQFSPLFQYLITLQEQQKVCQDFGSFMRTAFEIPIKYGAVLESSLPYGSQNLCYNPLVNVSLMEERSAYYQAHVGAQYIKAGASLQDMMAMAYGTNGKDGHPPCVAFLVYSNFQPNERGETPMPAGAAQGGHAIQMRGWSRRRNKVKVKNWWTKQWGVNGYGWLPMELFGLDPNQGGIWFDDAYALDITLPVLPEPEPEPMPDEGYTDGYADRAQQEHDFLVWLEGFYEDRNSEWDDNAVRIVQFVSEEMEKFTPPQARPRFGMPPTMGGAV